MTPGEVAGGEGKPPGDRSAAEAGDSPDDDARRAVGGPWSIAVDGPAASGKSTVGRMLADRLGYLYFDTGLLYRALTLIALEAGTRPDDGPALAALAAAHATDVVPGGASGGAPAVLVDGRDVTDRIRGVDVDAAVSPVSAHPEVRAALLGVQRRIAERSPVVMVGRDIGTIVLPDADLKVYLDASPEARARRRQLERVERGESVAYDDVLAAVRARDGLDSGRAVAPLTPAADAVVVSTDECDAEAVVRHLQALVARWPDRLTTEGGRWPCGGEEPGI